MKTRIAIIFPDTNVFVQCHPLEDLDWTSWMNYDELHLMVCRTVQRELDSLKNRKNDRAPRARRVVEMLRTLITDESDHIVAHTGQPIVKLYLFEPSHPSSDLKDTLDYSKPDDELVGYAYRHSRECVEASVSVLTHDTGPMMTAKSVGLRCHLIPNEWLIGSQQDSADAETARLKARIKELERQEPQIKLEFLNNRYKHDDVIEIDYPVYTPMPRNEIDTYVKNISRLVPMQTEFGSREPHERIATSLFRRMGMRESYVPAADEEIRRYRDVLYPHWLSSCESRLSDLHSALQAREPQPYFELAASNLGTRPARDVLVTFIAQGEFQLRVEPSFDTEEPDQQTDAVEDLPVPPQSPTGRWTGVFDHLSSITRNVGDIQRSIMTPLPGELTIPSLYAQNRISSSRDANSFYYKPQRPTEPTDSFSLECEQWRHKIETEVFHGLICIDRDRGDIDGALVCKIHAENLSRPVQSLVPVRIRTTSTSTETIARELLGRLRASAFRTQR